jgi:hypothetical protein
MLLQLAAMSVNRTSEFCSACSKPICGYAVIRQLRGGLAISKWRATFSGYTQRVIRFPRLRAAHGSQPVRRSQPQNYSNYSSQPPLFMGSSAGSTFFPIMCKSEQTVIKTSINLTRRGKACGIIHSTMLVFFRTECSRAGVWPTARTSGPDDRAL